MAIYQWVGGHTGYTGPGSGYSLTTQSWVDPFTGSITSGGDFAFGPFFWANPRNWREVITATGSAFSNYASTNRVPKGSDTVYFAGGFTSSTGAFTNTYSISCKYGGMSGDGITPSGLTAWSSGQFGTNGLGAGLTTAADKHNPITFIVFPSFRPGSPRAKYPQFDTKDTGELGVGADYWGDTSNFAPLRINTRLFTYTDGSTGGQAPYNIASGAKFALHNDIASATGGDKGRGKFTLIRGLTSPGTFNIAQHSIAMLKGYWNEITQQTGVVYAVETMSTGEDYSRWNIQNVPTKFGCAKPTVFDFILMSNHTLFEDSYIWGVPGGGGEDRLIGMHGWSGNSYLTIGNIGDGSISEIPNLELYSASTNQNAKVKLGSCLINKLFCIQPTEITVSEQATIHNYPVIRNAEFIQGSINLEHPVYQDWQQAILKYHPVDDHGLKIINYASAIDPRQPPATVVRGYPGMTLKTGPYIPTSEY